MFVETVLESFGFTYVLFGAVVALYHVNQKEILLLEPRKTLPLNTILNKSFKTQQEFLSTQEQRLV